MKLFDCFTFFNELELLKIRCEELKELNPIHVLVEANTTHTGDPKPFYFEENKHLFTEFNIRHIKVYDLPNNGDAWQAENAQRDAIFKGLTDCEDWDKIIITDLDEIPRKEAVAYYDGRMGVAALTMEKLSYYLNCLEGHQQWQIGKITTWEHLKTTTPNKLRNGGFNIAFDYAGWHFAWCGGIDRMFQKLDSFAHQESNTAELRNNLERKYETGESMWGNDFWRFVKIDETFPPYLFNNQKEFISLIKPV